MKPSNLYLILLLLCPLLMKCNKKSGNLSISGSYHSSTITEYDDPILYTNGKTITKRIVIEKFIKSNDVSKIGFDRQRNTVNTIKLQFNDTGAVIKQDIRDDAASFRIRNAGLILLEYWGLKDTGEGYYDIGNCVGLHDELVTQKIRALCIIAGFPDNCLYSKFLAISAKDNEFNITPISYYIKSVQVNDAGLPEIACIAERDNVYNEIHTNLANTLKAGDTVLLQYGRISLIKD